MITGAPLPRQYRKLDADLWGADGILRASSKLTSSEYYMPGLGIIFRLHAANRFETATRKDARDKAAGKMPKLASVAWDFVKHRPCSCRRE